MEKYLFVGVGGMVGSICRYGLSGLFYRVMGDRFPYGTFAVNIVGCFAIGVLMSLFEGRWLVPPNVRLFLTIGILGGFTTFSTFSYETVEMLKGGNFFLASLNIVGSLFCCLFATWGGSMIGKSLL
jgi:fluoride exporter